MQEPSMYFSLNSFDSSPNDDRNTNPLASDAVVAAQKLRREIGWPCTCFFLSNSLN
jgi:hypothetical protein